MITLLTLLLSIFTGYVIPRPQLLSKYIWFGWLYWVNPIAYSFEAVIADEFYDRTLVCNPSEVVPNGPGYDNPAYQGCAFPGAEVGSMNVPGSRYLSISFNYSRSHLWRNFGVGK